MAVTQITKRQIKDGAIDNSKVAAGAAIDSTKLADGANFIKKDGSVAFTGNQSLGGNRITSLGTPTSDLDAATKVYVDTQVANMQQIWKNKVPVKASATVNVTVSNPGTDTFDGIALSNGDRLLLQNQSAAAENGIYVFNGSGSALTRSTDADTWTELVGALVAVEQGTTYADKLYLCTSDSGGTVGTTGVSWSQVNGSGYTATNFVTRETPSGTINGVNTSFTLANTPVAGSEEVFVNGILQTSGSGNDYTISGTTITFEAGAVPETGDVLRVNYRK